MLSPNNDFAQAAAKKSGYELGFSGTPEEITAVIKVSEKNMNDAHALFLSTDRNSPDWSEITRAGSKAAYNHSRLWLDLLEATTRALHADRPENIQTLFSFGASPAIIDKLVELLERATDPGKTLNTLLAKTNDPTRQTLLDRTFLKLVEQYTFCDRTIAAALIKAGAQEPYLTSKTPQAVKTFIQDAKKNAGPANSF